MREAGSSKDPIVKDLRYVEAKLEFPELEPTGQLDRYFPLGVPLGGSEAGEVFVWQSALFEPSSDHRRWGLAVATVGGLAGFQRPPVRIPFTGGASGDSVIVRGTVLGEAELARLESYEHPTVRIEGIDDDEVVIGAGEIEIEVPSGSRVSERLSPRRARSSDGNRDIEVTPQLEIRYPGRRRLLHPPPEEDMMLFPDFGLDLETLPQPLPVPTVAGELEHHALAEALGVDIRRGSYARRVLWQAFAYTAFDPHRDAPAIIERCSNGRLLVVG